MNGNAIISFDGTEIHTQLEFLNMQVWYRTYFDFVILKYDLLGTL